MTEPKVSLICAMDNNRLIGNNNQLPWHLPADLQLFKQTTLGKPIIMGRKTFDSIGKALPGRQNIVITRSFDWTADQVDVATSIDEAVVFASPADEVMLIGGASLYEQTLSRASCLYLTLIDHIFEGDTWFPEIDFTQWKAASQQYFEADHKNKYSFSFVKYIRDKK